MTSLSKTFLTTFLSLSLLISLGAVAETEADSNLATGCAAQVAVLQPQPTVPAPRLARVDDNKVCQADLATLGDATLIDIRDARLYERLSLPGSLNIPMWRLKDSQGFKEKPIVLIDDGKSPAALMGQCQQLREAGFTQVRALSGGLRALHAAGRAMIGDAESIAKLYRLSAAEMQTEQGRPGWQLVAIGEIKAGELNTPYQIPHSENAADTKTALGALRALMAQHAQDNFILLTPSGEEATSLSAGLSTDERSRVLTLEGGAMAYQRYSRQHSNMLAQANKPLIRPCYER